MSKRSDFDRIMRRRAEKAQRRDGKAGSEGNSKVDAAINTPKVRMIDDTDDTPKRPTVVTETEDLPGSDVDDSLDIEIYEDDDVLEDDTADKDLESDSDGTTEESEKDESEDVPESGATVNTKVSESLKKDILRMAEDTFAELRKENSKLAQRVVDLEKRISILEKGDTKNCGRSGVTSSVIQIYEIPPDVKVDPYNAKSIDEAKENAFSISYFIKR